MPDSVQQWPDDSFRGRRPLPALCLFLIVAFALHLPTARAADPAPRGPNVATTDGEPSATALAIDELRLSDTLALYGERHADPIALVQAARIRKLLPAALRTAGPGASSRTWESLLTRAAQFAGGDRMIGALIDEVRALRLREVPVLDAGVRLLRKPIKRLAADRAEVRFGSGEVAAVYVRPESDAHVSLQLYVYDELNNLICGGASADELHCSWRPRWDGLFLIDVRNASDSDGEYVLAINREPVAR